MTRTINIPRAGFLIVVLIVWDIFAFLTERALNPLQMTNIIGFIFLLVVPGFLTYSSMSFGAKGFWRGIGIYISLSLLELMLVGLTVNTLLPLFGVVAPLSKSSLLIALTIFLGALCAMFFFRVESITLAYKRFVVFDRLRDLFYALAPSLFVVLAILGAIRLNNGGGNMLTYIMLVGIGAYIIAVVRELNRKYVFEDSVLPLAFFFLSLALLFMTSLRGWYTTGHDVQLEYRVFELTHAGQYWLIDNFKDAYNACMSITILPTILSTLLRIADPYVYKVIFQIIFAIVPPTIYLIASRYVETAIAFLATLYFIAFPTFFGDMPMLNRQEIAFVFLSSMVYVLFDEELMVYVRRFLFTLLGVGMVLSHYSTTYTVIALLVFVLCARPIVRLMKKFWQQKDPFRDSAVEGLSQVHPENPRMVTMWMAGVLILSSFIWSSVLTDTSSGSLTRVILKTVAVIRNNSKEDMRSSDVFYSLFTWGRPNPAKALQNYESEYVTPTREKDPSRFYPLLAYSGYSIVSIPDRSMPLTAIGGMVEKLGIHVQTFNYLFRQTSARVLQLLMLLGILYSVFRARYFKRRWELEYALLAFGSILMVASQVLLPVLSAEYGVLRAFEQSLIFLGVPIVIGSMVLVIRKKPEVQIWVATALLVIFFYSTTGVFTQALGGYPAQLHLANDGTYYENYYTHESELSAVEWMSRNVQKDSSTIIQTDRFEYQALHTISGVTIKKGIFPLLIEKHAYVFFGNANTTRNITSISWNSDVVTVNSLSGFLDEHKDLLYNNGQAKIYR